MMNKRNCYTPVARWALTGSLLLSGSVMMPALGYDAEGLENLIRQEIGANSDDTTYELKRIGNNIEITSLSNKDSYSSDTYSRNESTTVQSVILQDIQDLGGKSTQIGKISISNIANRTDRSRTIKSDQADEIRNNAEGVSVQQVDIENARYVENETISFSSVNINGIKVFDERDDIAFDVGQISLGPIKFPDFDAIDKLPRNERDKAGFKAVADFMDVFEFARVTDISGTAKDKDVEIPFGVKQFSFEQTRGDGGNRALRFNLDEISVPFQAFEATREFRRSEEAKRILRVVKNAGYTELNASFNWALNLDETKRTASLDYGLKLKDLIGLSYNLSAENLPTEIFNPADHLDFFEDNKQLEQRFMAIGFSGLNIRLENLSGFERILKAAALEFDQDDELLLQQMEAGAVFGATFIARYDSDFAKKVTDAVKVFFADPKNLEFSVNPDPAISIFELPIYFDGEPDPQVLIERFKPSIKANQ